MTNEILVDPATFPSLGALLDEVLLRHKSEVALLEADRKREASRWTYAEVDATAARVARRLQDLGMGPGSRVAILMSNQPRWLVTAVAVLRRGCTLVPLDMKLEAPEQRALVEHANADLVVVEHALWRRFAEGLPGRRVWVSEAPEGTLPDEQRWEALPEGEGESVARSRDDVACIVYSSGTGGRAKGCVLTHGAYLSQLAALIRRFPMAPGDRYFSVLPTNHAIDFMVGFLGPFTCGATVVHQRTLRPEMLRFTMQRYGITHMSVVPLLLTAFERALRESLDELSGWKRTVFDGLVTLHGALTPKGADPRVSQTLLRQVHAAFGGKLKLLVAGGAFVPKDQAEYFFSLGLPVVIGYGLTEACTVATVNDLRPLRGDSVGRPVDGVELRIDGPDAGGVGEVCLRGPMLMREYLDDPGLTAETLRDGWLHTGDLGWVDASGHLHLVGRRKDVIVTAGGKNVYPQDVEHAFDGAPVEELAVFAANTLWPQRTMVGEQLVAVVRPGKAPWSEVLAALRAKNRALPDFKRVSGVVRWERTFPRTASMKLKRGVFATELAAGTARDGVEPLGA